MSLFHRHSNGSVGSTVRIEAYSDAVIAIILTLLVLELHVPELHDTSVHGVLSALQSIFPELAAFAFSFLTISVFWVNHHHFFHELNKADWQLLWYNNFLLFWLALVPFTTAFLGQHPFIAAVEMVYSFNLFMAALAFMLMSHHAVRVGNLLHTKLSPADMRAHELHGWIGVVCYCIATIAAPFLQPLTIGLLLFIPLYYIVPRLMHGDHEHGG
jgi:uncharacterized membrane protein